MEFFKKRSTAWAFLLIVIVCSFFIGQAKRPADKIEILPSGVYVQDNADILSDETEDYMTRLNNGLVSSVGAEIQVVTINTVGGLDIFDVAIKHGVETNLSANSCVFLIAVDDVDAVIVQGEDLLYAFPDDELSYILQKNFTVNDFKSSDLDVPARNAFDDLISMYENHYGMGVIGSQYITDNTQHSAGMSGTAIAIILFVLIILLLVLIVSAPRRRRTVITPVGGMGRTVVPPRTGNYPPRGSYHTPPRYTGGSRTNNFGGNSRTGGFGSSSRGGSFGGSSRGGSFSSRSGFGGSSRSGGFGGGSRGGSFGGGSRGGGFRK